MVEIGNDDLRSGDIPPVGADWSQIWQFALSFDGYRVAGEECAEIANA